MDNNYFISIYKNQLFLEKNDSSIHQILKLIYSLKQSKICQKLHTQILALDQTQDLRKMTSKTLRRKKPLLDQCISSWKPAIFLWTNPAWKMRLKNNYSRGAEGRKDEPAKCLGYQKTTRRASSYEVQSHSRPGLIPPLIHFWTKLPLLRCYGDDRNPPARIWIPAWLFFDPAAALWLIFLDDGVYPTQAFFPQRFLEITRAGWWILMDNERENFACDGTVHRHNAFRALAGGAPINNANGSLNMPLWNRLLNKRKTLRFVCGVYARFYTSDNVLGGEKNGRTAWLFNT